jgi:hypothetical protein
MHINKCEKEHKICKNSHDDCLASRPNKTCLGIRCHPDSHLEFHTQYPTIIRVSPCITLEIFRTSPKPPVLGESVECTKNLNNHFLD